MNQMINQSLQGVITKPYKGLSAEKTISFSFPLKGYWRTIGVLSFMKKIYEKSFLRDFQNVLTSSVE